MASLYDAGYGGDAAAAGRQSFLNDSMDQMQQVPQEVSPYAQQAQRMSAPGQRRGQGQNLRRRMGQGAQQMTFRQMQSAGMARPAPPMPEPEPVQQVQPVPDQQAQQMQLAQQDFANFRQAQPAQQPVLYNQQPMWQSGGDAPEAVPSQVAPYAQAPMTQAPMPQAAPQQAFQPMAAPQPVLQQAPAPAAAPTTGAPAVGTMPQFTGDINAYIGQALNNPGGYSFDETKKLYDRLGQNIDDDFAQREVALREEMAARGLSDSSIKGGRLADLNVGRRSAQQDLLQTLGSQQAQALFGQQTGFLDRLLGLRGQDQTAAYQQGQLGLGQAELNRGLMNDQDRLMLALLGVGDF